MKHIKTFETLFTSLKKYILWKGTDDNYYIFETGKKYNIGCNIQYKYMYDKQRKKLKNVEKEYDNDRYSIDRTDLIIFQSDNIQDCIDEIYALENMTKFNL